MPSFLKRDRKMPQGADLRALVAEENLNQAALRRRFGVSKGTVHSAWHRAGLPSKFQRARVELRKLPESDDQVWNDYQRLRRNASRLAALYGCSNAVAARRVNRIAAGRFNG